MKAVGDLLRVASGSGGVWTLGDSGLMNKPEIIEKIPEQFRFSPYIPLMSDNI